MLMHGWESWQPESQQAKGKAVTDGHGWSKLDSNSKSSKGDVLKCNVLERALLSAWWGPPLEASLCPNHCSTWVTLENTEIPVAQGGNLRDLHSLLVPFTIKRYLGTWIISEKAHSLAGVERIGWKQRDPLISDLHNLHGARPVNACLSPARGLTGISRSLGQERWTERERMEQNKSNAQHLLSSVTLHEAFTMEKLHFMLILNLCGSAGSGPDPFWLLYKLMS